MLKHKIIFTLFLYSSFLITEEDNVEVDLLFLKIQELEIEIAELRNILESQNYLIQKLIQESASDDVEDNENTNNIVSDNIVRFVIDDTRIREIYETAIQSLQDQDLKRPFLCLNFCR